MSVTNQTNRSLDKQNFEGSNSLEEFLSFAQFSFHDGSEKGFIGSKRSPSPDLKSHDTPETKRVLHSTSTVPEKNYSYRWNEVVWRNVLIFILLHLGAFYGFYLVLWGWLKWQTVVTVHSMGLLASFGVTAGAHRLWSHRSYKAKTSLRLLLIFLNTMALQNDVYEWCRDHRVHHKFSETNADPHNSNRGFFFAHMGWLLLKKHPDVIAKGKQIDLSDLMADPLVRFQRRFYIPLVILIWGVIPTYLPHLLWGEPVWNCVFACVAFRYVFSLHITWLVNSAAHLYGTRPYNDVIQPRENMFVANMAMGEGYHNYHHTFPWDYSTSELGWDRNFNATTAFVDLCARYGLAYDLKKPTPEMVKARIERLGDGSYDPEEIKKRTVGFKEIGIFILIISHPLIIGLTVKMLLKIVS